MATLLKQFWWSSMDVDAYVLIVLLPLAVFPHILFKYYWEIARQEEKFSSIFLHVLLFLKLS